MRSRTTSPHRPLHAAALLLASLALAALAIAPAPARAQCSYVTPTAWQTHSVANAVGYGVLPGAAMKSSWTVAAVRPVAGEDWDMALYSATAAAPTCVGGTLLASSTYGGAVVDFIVGDGTTNAHVDVYPRWYRYSGAAQPRASWADSAITLTAGQSWWYGVFEPDTLVHVYQFALTAGVRYQIEFYQAGNPGGTMGATAHLFRNPGSGTYWAGRGAALASFTGPGTYTAPASGNYVLVVANDARAQGTYHVMVSACTTPVALTSKALVSPTGNQPSYTAAPGAARWGVVGYYGSGYDGPDLYRTQAAGTAPPDCFTNFAAWCGPVDGFYTQQVGVVNFEQAGAQPFYVSLRQRGPLGQFEYQPDLEWDAGSTALTVDGVWQSGYIGVGSPADAYDVQLTAGATYRIYFTADLDLPNGARLFVFGNTGLNPSGFYSTSQALLSAYGPGQYTFTAPVSGWYGVVVVGPAMWDGGPYTLGIGSAACPFPTLLADGVNASLPSPDGYAEFDAPTTWVVFAARGATTADDWDVAVSASPTGSAAPGCIGPALGSSTYGTGTLDFVAVHSYRTYFDDPPVPFFARAHRISAGGTAATVMAASARSLPTNGPTFADTLYSGELAHVFHVNLSTGTTYNFEFTRLTTGLTVHLLYAPYGVTAGAARVSALASSAGNFTYAPTQSGDYALVVANDNITGGGYRLRYGACLTPLATQADAPFQGFYGTRVYSVPQAASGWSAFGVRYGAADWDLMAAPGSSTTWSSCLSGSGASSSLSTTHFTDFVVTDFHHVTPATWYAKPYQYAPAPLEEAYLEWSPATAITPNELYAPAWTTIANDVLRCHEVHLVGGATYTIEFESGGAAKLRALLFRNPGSGAYWAGRASALLDLAPNLAGTAYTAPATDDYAIVVVDDDGVADSYQLQVNYCAAPTALVNTTPITVAPVGFASFTPASYFWNAVGVRGPGDWDLAVYGSPTGGPAGTCFSSLLAASTGVGGADFVVGDFNSGANPIGTYYARPYRLDPTGAGTLEWASGTSTLSPGAAPASRTTGPGDVLEIWDAHLLSTQAYNVYFTHTGAADVRALLFRNPGGAYWAPRSAAVWQGTAHGTFVPPTSGWYGVVVVNDNGLAGSYQIGFSQGGVDAPPPPPAVTALRGVAPNPARGETTIEYALHQGATVRLEVLDMAGRRVATLADGERAAGTYRVPWSRTAGGGAGVPPGLYFVRLQVAGRTVGERKVALVQ